jgi:hypothetical protein
MDTSDLGGYTSNASELDTPWISFHWIFPPLLVLVALSLWRPEFQNVRHALLNSSSHALCPTRPRIRSLSSFRSFRRPVLGRRPVWNTVGRPWNDERLVAFQC